MFGLGTGMEVPDADEDQLREIAAAWDKAANDFEAVINELTSAAEAVLSHVGGAAGEGFRDLVEKLVTKDPNYFPTAITQMRKTAEYLHKASNQLEYTKWSVLAMLVIIAAQIIAEEVLSAFDFGISLSLIPGLVALG